MGYNTKTSGVNWNRSLRTEPKCDTSTHSRSKWLKSVYRWLSDAHFSSFIRSSESYPSIDGPSHISGIIVRVGDCFTTDVEKLTTQRNKDKICLTGDGEVGPEARRCWKTWEFRDSFISLRVTAEAVAMTTRCKPWVGGRGGTKKRRRWWGLEKKNRRNKKLPSLVSEQFMWTVCQVARWIPPGHYRFRRRANREMESVPVISAQTHSAWWAQMRVSKASHVWNEGGGGTRIKPNERRNSDTRVWTSTPKLPVGEWLMTEKIKYIKNTSATFKVMGSLLKIQLVNVVSYLY